MEKYTIRYYSNEVQQEIYAFPPTLKARYIGYAKRMAANGTHLGEPHTKAMGNGLFELRLKGAEGIGRVFLLCYCRQKHFYAAQLHQKNAKNTAKRSGNRHRAHEGDKKW